MTPTLVVFQSFSAELLRTLKRNSTQGPYFPFAFGSNFKTSTDCPSPSKSLALRYLEFSSTYASSAFNASSSSGVLLQLSPVLLPLLFLCDILLCITSLVRHFVCSSMQIGINQSHLVEVLHRRDHFVC